ncbi:MAG: CvpA family protein [Phycisphaerae bacterium]
MIIIILAFALVALIAFFQIVQGLFSAIIMMVCTLLSALMALAFYEELALQITWMPGYERAMALGGIFIITLLVLRLIFDLTIRKNVVFGQWGDRIGGGIVGVVTGNIIVGLLLVAVQMLPFNATVMTYSPYNASLERDQRTWPFLPDDFFVGFAEAASASGMSGNTNFETVHDELLLEEFARRNTAGLNGRVTAEEDSLIEAKAYIPDQISGTPDNPQIPTGTDTQTIVIRTTIHGNARNTTDVKNAVNWWQLPATHFRLVTRDNQSYYPIGYLTYLRDVDLALARNEERNWELHSPKRTEEQPDLRIADLFVARKYKSDRKTLTVDWVYTIPEDAEIDHIVFRNISYQNFKQMYRGMPAGAELGELKALTRRYRKK